MSILVTRTSIVAGGGGGDSFSHGDQITITGSGFGASNPMKYFSGGTDGVLEQTSTSAVPNEGANSNDATATTNSMNWIRFDRDPVVEVDGTRGKVAYYTLTSSGSNNIECSSEYRFASTIPTGGKLLMQYWMKASFSGSGDPSQYKLFRICGDSDITDTATNLVCHYLAESNNIHENPGGSSVLMYGGDGNGYWEKNLGWQRIEVFIEPGTQGNRDGQVNMRVFDGTNSPSFQDFGSGSPNFYDIRTDCLCYPAATRYGSVIWQNWVGNGYTNLTGSSDDHFVATGSFARVELWNSATPSLAFNRNSQRATSWAGTSITIDNLNADGFSAGAAVLVVLSDSRTDTVLATKNITIV